MQLRFRLASTPGQESDGTRRAGVLWEGSRVEIRSQTPLHLYSKL